MGMEGYTVQLPLNEALNPTDVTSRKYMAEKTAALEKIESK